MAQPMNRGPGDNQNFFDTWLEKNPIYAGLIFRSLGHQPFLGDWTDKRIKTMIFFGYVGKQWSLTPTGRIDVNQLYAIVMAEILIFAERYFPDSC